MARFSDVWPVASTAEGWLTEGQARALFAAAARVRPGAAIVEIGSHHGRSTIVLAAGADPAVRVNAIDPFDAPRWGGGSTALETFRRNVERAGLAERIVTFRGLSVEAAAEWNGEPVGLLYIDGAHDRASVDDDILGWYPHLALGGVVAFHDAFSALGVTHALLRRHLLSRRFRYAGSVRTLCLFAREDLSPGQAALGGLRLVGRLPYLARNLSVKVAMRRGWTPAVRLLGHRESVFPY